MRNVQNNHSFDSTLCVKYKALDSSLALNWWFTETWERTKHMHSDVIGRTLPLEMADKWIKEGHWKLEYKNRSSLLSRPFCMHFLLLQSSVTLPVLGFVIITITMIMLLLIITSMVHEHLHADYTALGYQPMCFNTGVTTLYLWKS